MIRADIYHVYTIFQWLLFFFLYSIIGWVWESCYVSAKQHSWVNRGFMHGPMLPIYGAGALCILLSTLPVAKSVILIFLVGMIASTVLEYVTGYFMERLFHVRYWDYTKNRFNLHGYICAGSSLGWGLFSVLLVRVVHPVVSDFVIAIPVFWSQAATLVLLCGAACDFSLSFVEAMDLRDMLERLAEHNKELQRVKERIDRAVDRAVDLAVDKAAASNKEVTERIDELKARYEELKARGERAMAQRSYRRSARILRRNPGMAAIRRNELSEVLKEMIRRDR